MYRLLSIAFFGIAVICLWFPWMSNGIDATTFELVYEPAYKLIWMQPIIIVGYLGFLCTIFIPKFHQGKNKIIPFIGILILVLGLLNLAVRPLFGFDSFNFTIIDAYVSELVEPAFLIAVSAGILSLIMYAIYLKKSENL
ncbi:hypothetical protein [Listeria monocytogenes]|uniref:hypothetical protein n=1 Tax=Listeria monocytogenes TaxID=1639 RepID=UPI0012EFD571|nr:hypothetical protein [Listeria monocytogenes]EAW7144187.1 hypothetical protein [Listeria monocytogenes]ECR1112875.1 hypothetical protein [Listeria monocytogenes]EHF5324247.1 hypothetical protein [Listeria monocytogenes]EHK4066626.1 hypothetical protein [Listeria monocytogenes]